jgi:hypothetical protein
VTVEIHSLMLPNLDNINNKQVRIGLNRAAKKVFVCIAVVRLHNTCDLASDQLKMRTLVRGRVPRNRRGMVFPVTARRLRLHTWSKSVTKGARE